MSARRHAGDRGKARRVARGHRDCLDCAHTARAVPAAADGITEGSHRARPTAEVRDPDVNGVGLDILIVLAIVVVGGFFAAAEMALVSLREGQVRALARRGKRGQRAARLAQDPNRFLSAVQIGVTVATLLSGALGAATLASHLKSELAHYLSPAVASVAAVAGVTLAISFFTLVFGELAPKRIALQRNERVSLAAAPLLDRMATLARPLVWLLSRSTNLVVRLLGGDPAAGRGVMTDEELRDLVAGHQAFSSDERRIVREVFDAGKRQIREVLVPRTEVEFLPAVMPMADAAAIAASAPYSRFPVYQESYDDVIGFVHARDLLGPRSANTAMRVGEVCRPVKVLPISKTATSRMNTTSTTVTLASCTAASSRSTGC
jgi:putative hemolysin